MPLASESIMTAAEDLQLSPQQHSPGTVVLHIYDIKLAANGGTNDNANFAITRVNKFCRDLAWGGVFHGAIEVRVS